MHCLHFACWESGVNNTVYFGKPFIEEVFPMKKEKKPLRIPPAPYLADGLINSFDPFGSYTGVTVDPEEKPIQDADDL